MNLRKSISLLFTGLCLLGAAPSKRSASAPRAAAPAAIPKVEFEKYTLPNGLQVMSTGSCRSST